MRQINYLAILAQWKALIVATLRLWVYVMLLIRKSVASHYRKSMLHVKASCRLLTNEYFIHVQTCFLIQTVSLFFL